MHDTEDTALECALDALFTKSRENECLLLNEEETRILAKYIRRIRRLRAMEAQDAKPILVTVEIDGRAAAQAILPHLSDAVRNSTGKRNF